MNKKQIFKNAHKLTRKMVKEFKVKYITQLGINLKYMYALSKKREEVKEGIKATKKVIVYHEDISINLHVRIMDKYRKYGEGSHMVKKDEQKLKEVNENLNMLYYYISNDRTLLKKYDYFIRKSPKADYNVEGVNCSLYEAIKGDEHFNVYISELDDIVKVDKIGA